MPTASGKLIVLLAKSHITVLTLTMSMNRHFIISCGRIAGAIDREPDGQRANITVSPRSALGLVCLIALCYCLCQESQFNCNLSKPYLHYCCADEYKLVITVAVGSQATPAAENPKYQCARPASYQSSADGLAENLPVAETCFLLASFV